MKQKNMFIVMIMFFLPFILCAQTERWVYRYNGSGNDIDIAYSVVYGLDDNIYAAGKSMSLTNVDFMVISLTTAGDTNWIYKYDELVDFDGSAYSIVYGPDNNIYAAGNGTGMGTAHDFMVISLTTAGDTNWTYRYNGSGNDEDDAFSVVYGLDGNIYAAGKSTGISTSWDFMVISLTTAGDTNWTYRYDGSDNSYDVAHSIVYGSDGNIYAAGVSDDAVSSWDFLVISLTPSGDTNWVYQYDGDGYSYDMAFSIVYGLDGNIYAAGYSTDIDTSQCFTVISLTTAGDTNWTYKYKGPGDGGNIARSIVYGPDNNIYAAGYSTGAGSDDDFTVISLTTAGDTNWTYRYNGAANQRDGANSIVYGSDNNIYAAGWCTNLVTSKDFTVISLDTTGAENWVYAYSAASSFYWDEAHSIAYGLDGNIYAAGYSIYSTGAGIWDFTVIGLGPVGIEEEARSQKPEARLMIYPNPFSKLIKISFGKGHPDRITHSSYGTGSAECIELRIYDASGRLVRQWDYPTIRLSNQVSWDGTDHANQTLPSGVYFLRFQAGDYKETRKLLLVR